jgi:transposase
MHILWYNNYMLTKDIESSLLALPADVPGLQTMVLELNEKMDEVVKNHELESHLLRERIRQLEHQLYGRKSEKLALYDGFEQSCLFDSDQATQSLLAEPKSEVEITIPSHKRKKGGRKDLPADLERVEVVHDISQSEKQCGCGSEMSRIGEEVSEQLEMVPAHFWVVRHIRPKYACKHCEGVDGNEGERSVKIAPVPAQLLPKTISTPGLLSHILVSKFCDSLPFYRQENQFKRLGFELSRATMCNWAIKVADRCNRLVELLRQEILSGPLINIDETTFQVLRERTPGRRVDSKSYMWVKRGGLPGKEGVVYHYAESRSGSVASDLVGAYRGYVQTDGYSGYDFLDHRDGIIHVGCWAHVRRKFLDVLKASGVKNVKRVKHELKDLGHAGKALQTIRDLYAIEKEAIEQELTAELVYEERRRKAKPILDDFEIWLKEIAPTAPPKSLLGKALAYTLGQWHRLIRYLDDGIIRMDNNLAENAIRPFVVGRKNWLFFDQPGGAEAGAILYSLIETARTNGLEPYQYFCYLFDKLPHISQEEDEQLKTLLPMNLNPDILKAHQEHYMERRKK